MMGSSKRPVMEQNHLLSCQHNDENLMSFHLVHGSEFSVNAIVAIEIPGENGNIRA